MLLLLGNRKIMVVFASGFIYSADSNLVLSVFHRTHSLVAEMITTHTSSSSSALSSSIKYMCDRYVKLKKTKMSKQRQD